MKKFSSKWKEFCNVELQCKQSFTKFFMIFLLCKIRILCKYQNSKRHLVYKFWRENWNNIIKILTWCLLKNGDKRSWFKPGYLNWSNWCKWIDDFRGFPSCRKRDVKYVISVRCDIRIGYVHIWNVQDAMQIHFVDKRWQKVWI